MIALIPLGNTDEAVLEFLRQPLEGVFGQPVKVGDRIPLPPQGWDQRRGQYLASFLLALLPSPQSGDRALAVADVDLYAPGLNFVFGQADTVGQRALISLSRLRQEFYSLPPQRDIFWQRAVKEAVHELGHTYGLGHCAAPSCVMHFSNSLRDTDLKGWAFCYVCCQKISQTSERDQKPQ